MATQEHGDVWAWAAAWAHDWVRDPGAAMVCAVSVATDTTAPSLGAIQGRTGFCLIRSITSAPWHPSLECWVENSISSSLPWEVALV